VVTGVIVDHGRRAPTPPKSKSRPKRLQ
jgi:hypothetical protein